MFKILKDNKGFVLLAALVLVGMLYSYATTTIEEEGITDDIVRQYFGGGITINNETLYSGHVYQNPPPQCDCAPCTVWSTCYNAKQVRTCHKCDASTNYLCRLKMEERDC
jgi:hypothetical protein